MGHKFFSGADVDFVAGISPIWRSFSGEVIDAATVTVTFYSVSIKNTEGDDDLVVPGDVGPAVRQVEGDTDHVLTLDVLVTGGDLQPPLDHVDGVLLHELVHPRLGRTRPLAPVLDWPF